jgi:ribonuclease D
MLEFFKAGSNSQKESIDHSQWSQRPLSKQQLEYAAQDVAFLLDAFETMIKQETITDTIKMLSRERASDVSCLEVEYDINI